MLHVIEPAASGRSRCRGCGRPIAKGSLRFGERLPNPFGGGEMSLWFHLRCAAYRRPEPFLETLAHAPAGVDDAESLEAAGRFALAHRRVPRIAGLERAPSSQARCRQCREVVGKGDLRIPLVFYAEGQFDRSGFVHATCAAAYFGTAKLLDCVRHFAGNADDDDLAEVERLLD